MTTWKKQLEMRMAKHGETLKDIEANTMTRKEMNEEFDNGYGGKEGIPFTVWTKQSVYFPICYDGAEWVGRVARHPDGQATEHQGGG